jgi:hypothetical protein
MKGVRQKERKKTKGRETNRAKDKRQKRRKGTKKIRQTDKETHTRDVCINSE